MGAFYDCLHYSVGDGDGTGAQVGSSGGGVGVCFRGSWVIVGGFGWQISFAGHEGDADVVGAGAGLGHHGLRFCGLGVAGVVVAGAARLFEYFYEAGHGGFTGGFYCGGGATAADAGCDAIR